MKEKQNAYNKATCHIASTQLAASRAVHNNTDNSTKYSHKPYTNNLKLKPQANIHNSS